MFVDCKPFQSSLMFASQLNKPLSGVKEDPALIRLERLIRDKHYSLFGPFVSHSPKTKFYKIDTCGSFQKYLMLVITAAAK